LSLEDLFGSNLFNFLNIKITKPGLDPDRIRIRQSLDPDPDKFLDPYPDPDSGDSESETMIKIDPLKFWPIPPNDPPPPHALQSPLNSKNLI
jgi:hypothetical protein